MSAIAAWWAIPVVATMLAMAWVAWASRMRGPGDVSDTTRSYAKFRAAMERPSVHLNDDARRSRRHWRRPGRPVTRPSPGTPRPSVASRFDETSRR